MAEKGELTAVQIAHAADVIIPYGKIEKDGNGKQINRPASCDWCDKTWKWAKPADKLKHLELKHKSAFEDVKKGCYEARIVDKIKKRKYFGNFYSTSTKNLAIERNPQLKLRPCTKAERQKFQMKIAHAALNNSLNNKDQQTLEIKDWTERGIKQQNILQCVQKKTIPI